MRNLSALIIDDNLEDAAHLEEILRKLPIFVTIKTVQNPTDGFSELLNEHFDIIFLDLVLPTISGLELAKTMSFPPTIVVTSYPSYAAACFDIDHIVDFIEKPVTMTRLQRAISRTQQKVRKDPNHLFLKTGHRNQHFKIEDILYIEADGIYSKVCLRNGDKVLVNDNISEIEKQLQHTQLLRLHKSYIYNTIHITSFDSRHLWIGNQKFALGVNYRGHLGEYLNVEP